MGLLRRSVGPMVRVELHAEGEVPVVDVDPNQLEMALLNLAVNARDAMIAGGVLTIGLTEQIVDLDDQLGIRPGRYVVLSVRDTGEGMDPETLAKAVEPFFSTKGIGKGTGLGLSMVRNNPVARCGSKAPCQREQLPNYGCQLPGQHRFLPDGRRTSFLKRPLKPGFWL
jgi:signal transduction histidine kinase